MTTTKIEHEWSKGTLFAKAQMYAEAMMGCEEDDWKFGLWSAFTLEALVRAAVAHTSPVLVADTGDWKNILYALGGAPHEKKYNPKSATVSELMTRLQSIDQKFTLEHVNFCASHFDRRNKQVHTGSLPFHDTPATSWLPMFYTVCSILMEKIEEP